MFGFNSTQRSTSTKSWAGDGGDQLVVQHADGFLLRFEPYPEMTAPQPAVEWHRGEPEWANDIWGDEVDDFDESGPQPGYGDQDYDD